MDLLTTRRVGLGVAGALAAPARNVGSIGLRVTVFGWRTPLAAPVRALAAAAERRGAGVEQRLITEITDTSARALRAPLLDRVVRSLIEARLLERITAEALDGTALERVLAVAAERRAGVRVADVVLADDSVERLLAHVLDQPAVDRLLERALTSASSEQRVAELLDQPALAQALERALSSRFAHTATDLVLASEELQRVVGHVARSEEVRAALQSQTHGLVDDVSDELRDRTSNVDDRMEGVARRLLRRRVRPEPFVSFDDGSAPA